MLLIDNAEYKKASNHTKDKRVSDITIQKYSMFTDDANFFIEIINALKIKN